MQRVVTFAALFGLAVQAATKECYWANGQSLTTTETTNFVPCYPDAEVSHCCAAGEACLNNGLCFGADLGIPYRGACTDVTWPTNSICGGRKYCEGANTWANIHECVNGSVWCGPGTLCSSDETPYQFFKLPSGSVLGIANASSTTSNTPSNSSDLATSCAAALTSSNCSDRVPTGVPIGVGVGIGLPLLMAIGTLGFLYSRERKRRSAGRKYSAAYVSGDHDQGGVKVHNTPKYELAADHRSELG